VATIGVGAVVAANIEKDGGSQIRRRGVEGKKGRRSRTCCVVGTGLARGQGYRNGAGAGASNDEIFGRRDSGWKIEKEGCSHGAEGRGATHAGVGGHGVTDERFRFNEGEQTV
jgi:hypothetical protein